MLFCLCSYIISVFSATEICDMTYVHQHRLPYTKMTEGFSKFLNNCVEYIYEKRDICN
jgi:hypothetical protein